MKNRILIWVGLVALGASTCSASIIEVAPTHGPGGNTVRVSDNDPSAWCSPSGRSSYDNLWGVNQHYWESNSDTENCPEIRTTVSGLANSAYDVYLTYWTPGSWDIQAKLTGGSYTTYNSGNGVALGGGNYRAYIGTVGAGTGVTSFSVDIDDVDNGVKNTRSLYTGIAYEAVPEPASLMLVTLAGAGLIWIRRRFLI